MRSYRIIKAILFLGIFFPSLAAADKYYVYNGTTSNTFRLYIENDDGTPKTDLTHSSSGLIISTIANNEATATAYTQASSNIETITTLGTFATPTSGKARFKLVDATNHPGLYEVQIADARFAVSSAKSLIVTVSGVSGVKQTSVEFDLRRPEVTIKDGTGTGEIDTSSGKVSIASGGIGPLSVGYDGALASESGTTLGLASGAVIADDQFNTGWAITVYSTAGSPLARSCIVDSVNSGDTIVTREDISALVAVSDNYFLQADAGCSANTTYWNGAAVATPDTPGYVKTTIKDGTGTGEVDTTSGKVAISNNGISTLSIAFNGALTSESGTTLGLASGAVVADDQFNNGWSLAVYSTTGVPLARSCVADSVNTGDTVVTKEDISALVAVSDNYFLVPDAGCNSTISTTSLTAIVTAIFAGVYETEGSITVQEFFKYAGAVLFGRSASGGLTFKTPNNNATRVTATVDGSKNRTAISLNP